VTATAVDLRGAMSRFATGVTVVGTYAPDGTPVGTTANAVSSVSLDPPLVLVCLAHESHTLAALRTHGGFAISVLAGEHADLAVAFARPAVAADGPVVPGALAVLECDVHDVLPAGDHAIVLGRVTATEVAGDARSPLLFFRSRLSAPDELERR
jgi:flavin reductase (DIM6/NTAB) family NADH-FMN oxidoreductase RutF